MPLMCPSSVLVPPVYAPSSSRVLVRVDSCSYRLGLLALPLAVVSCQYTGNIGNSIRSSCPGYSFKTNEYGLAVDNVVAFNFVLPSGEVIKVTKDSYPDLFFGLKVYDHLPSFCA